MKANTRLFGEIEIDDDKIIKLEQGIIGFPYLQNFALIYDEEDDVKAGAAIKWLQSMDEPEYAVPVMTPTDLVPDYNPTVSDEVFQTLGNLNPFNTFILVTVTVPQEIEKITINLKAPFVINMDTNKGCQVIVEDDYAVKYPIYDIIKSQKEKAGE